MHVNAFADMPDRWNSHFHMWAAKSRGHSNFDKFFKRSRVKKTYTWNIARFSYVKNSFPSPSKRVHNPSLNDASFGLTMQKTTAHSVHSTKFHGIFHSSRKYSTFHKKFVCRLAESLLLVERDIERNDAIPLYSSDMLQSLHFGYEVKHPYTYWRNIRLRACYADAWLALVMGLASLEWIEENPMCLQALTLTLSFWSFAKYTPTQV